MSPTVGYLSNFVGIVLSAIVFPLVMVCAALAMLCRIAIPQQLCEDL